MAGQAEKKRAQKAENYVVYFQGAILVVNVVYLLGFLFSSVGISGLFEFWESVALALFSVVSYFTYNSIARSLALGMNYEYAQDMFAMNLLVQFLVLFTSYAGTEVKIDGEEFLIMDESDILAILD